MKKLLVLAALLFVGLGYSQTYRISTVGESKQFVIEDVDNGVRERPYLNREVLADTTSQGNINIYRQLSVDYLKPIGFPKVAGRPYTAFVDGNNSDATFANAAAVLTWFADNTGFNSASGGSGAGSISDGSVTEAKLSSEVAVKLNTSPVNVKSYGATGDGTTDDGQDIQDAIDAVYALGGGEVFVPAGEYKVTSTVYVKDKVHLRLEKGASIVAHADINVIRVGRGSELSGGEITFADDQVHNEAGIYFYAGNEGNIAGNDITYVHNILVNGNGTSYPYVGSAVKMYADKITEGENAASITAVKMTNIKVRGGWLNGLHLVNNEDSGVGGGQQSWINNNLFSDWDFDNIHHVLVTEQFGTGSPEIRQNVFENFSIQAESFTYDVIVGSETFLSNRMVNWSLSDFNHSNDPAIIFTHETARQRDHANVITGWTGLEYPSVQVSQAFPENSDRIDNNGEELWGYFTGVYHDDYSYDLGYADSGRTLRRNGSVGEGGPTEILLPDAVIGLRYAFIVEDGNPFQITPKSTDRLGSGGPGVPYVFSERNTRIEIRCYRDDNWTIMSNSTRDVMVIPVTSSRNITATDIGNTMACTITSTLTITEDFDDMAIGQIINLEAHGITLTVTGASGVTVNGNVAGSEAIDGTTNWSGGILRKTGTNSYIVL